MHQALRDARAIDVDLNCGLERKALLPLRRPNRPQLWTPAPLTPRPPSSSATICSPSLDLPTIVTQVGEVARRHGSRRCSSDHGRARSKQPASARATAGATTLLARHRHGAPAFCGCCRHSPQTGVQDPRLLAMSSPRRLPAHRRTPIAGAPRPCWAVGISFTVRGWTVFHLPSTPGHLRAIRSARNG